MIDPVTASERPAGDILSRVVRITLGGREYALPVRSIRANREWKRELDALTAAKVEALTSAKVTEGSDWLEQILSVLENDDVEKMLDLLISYDTAGKLPSKAEIEEIEPDASMDILRACREVWRAASPFVDVALETIEETTRELLGGAGSPPTSSSQPSTAGRRKKSKPH